MPTRKEFAEIEPLDQTAWRQWLMDNHGQKDSVWVILAKKGSGLPNSLKVDEVVDEALCFGWIDSVPNKVDDVRYKVLVSPRKPKSNWSRVNKEKIVRLEKEGLIAAPGWAMIELAKKTGTWTALDDVDNLVIPADLAAAFAENELAKGHFEAFPPSTRRGILEWIFNAKRPATRAKRIAETVDLAEQNIRANQYRQPKKK